jgi:hypothetical protein
MIRGPLGRDVEGCGSIYSERVDDPPASSAPPQLRRRQWGYVHPLDELKDRARFERERDLFTFWSERAK